MRPRGSNAALRTRRTGVRHSSARRQTYRQAMTPPATPPATKNLGSPGSPACQEIAAAVAAANSSAAAPTRRSARSSRAGRP